VFHWPPKGPARSSFSLRTILQLNVHGKKVAAALNRALSRPCYSGQPRFSFITPSAVRRGSGCSLPRLRMIAGGIVAVLFAETRILCLGSNAGYAAFAQASQHPDCLR